MSALIADVARLGIPALVVLAALLVFAESAILTDMFVPGEAGLLLVSAAAADASAPLWAVVVAATVGGVAGDSAGYLLGRRGAPWLTRRWGWFRTHVERRLAAARPRFERRGAATVAVARWVGALRAVVPVVAGGARMRYRRFLLWDAPSTAAWATVVCVLGYTFGDDIAGAIDRIGTAVTAVVVIVIVVVVWRRRLRGGRPT